MATREEIIQIMRILLDYYQPKEEITKGKEVYIRALLDIPADILQDAAYDHIASSQWFPKVSELRASARKILHNNGRSMEYHEFEEGGIQLKAQYPKYWFRDELGAVWMVPDHPAIEAPELVPIAKEGIP